jgi:phosphatidylserine/phosphatidylglycerophosphate/cardiolipin synthase-like enzyme
VRAAALVVALHVAVPGPAAVFNIPSGPPRQQNAIARHLEDLVAAAPPGALIRIAVYEFTSAAFARTLVAAWRRGVRVRLVVDAASRGSAAYARVAGALGTDRDRPSWVVGCRGCIGDKLMHNKFFLFSRTGARTDVVVQSSANLTTTDQVRTWNNAVTISDSRLYRAYGRYFAALAARRHRAGGVARSGRVTLYTFPARRDVLLALLRPVTCRGGTSVHVTTYEFTRIAVARRLRTLARRGCDVRVAYTHLGEGIRALLAGGPRLLSSRYTYVDARTGRPVEAYVHSKYVTIHGTYGGRERSLVITGSPNITRSGLRRNDEAMLVVEDAGVQRAYEANFARLWRTA